MPGVYHVVCHDCRFEGLYETTAAAIENCQRHERNSNHSVSRLEISRPNPQPNA